MKNILLALLLSPSIVMAAPNDTTLNQRDANNVLVTRTLPDPNENSFLIYNNTTNLPVYAGIGTGLSFSSGDINVTFPAQVQPDWNAVTGLGVILNKPAIPDGTWGGIIDKPAWASTFNGSYYSLTSLPSIFDGTWGSLTGKPLSFNPSSHAHTSFDISDISAGVGRDLITAPSYAWVRNIMQDDAWAWMDDVEIAGGISAVGLSNDYNDLDNLPTIPSAVNADWNSSSGASQILNKPALFSGAYNDLTGRPAIPTLTSQLTNDSGYATSSYVNAQVATKLTIPTGTTSQVVLGNGTLGALPVPQVIQRTRVQTDASGNYTWTYPVPYGSGVIPVITAISESASSTVPQGVQIVGVPTNISATFKVINLPSTSVLSIVVLGAPTGSQAYIHLTAVAP